MDESVLVVKVPQVADATAKRMAATEFEEPYVPSEGPRLRSLPAFEPDPDDVHVLMEAGGVRGRLLPICARGCAKAIELFLLNVKRDNKIDAFAKGPLQTEYSAEVTEDLQEVGGFGFYCEPTGPSGSREMYLHLHSITTGRGVVFGPLTLGDADEIHGRLFGAFEKLSPRAVERSIVKLSIPARPRKIVQAWEHGERPPPDQMRLGVLVLFVFVLFVFVVAVFASREAVRVALGVGRRIQLVALRLEGRDDVGLGRISWLSHHL